jgi:hypothetical protein
MERGGRREEEMERERGGKRQRKEKYGDRKTGRLLALCFYYLPDIQYLSDDSSICSSYYTIII